jgi:hypothetical protein
VGFWPKIGRVQRLCSRRTQANCRRHEKRVLMLMMLPASPPQPPLLERPTVSIILETSTRGERLASYQGSCHCGAVTFRVDAKIRGDDDLRLLALHALMSKVHETELTCLGARKCCRFTSGIRNARSVTAAFTPFIANGRRRTISASMYSVWRLRSKTSVPYARPRAWGCRWSMRTRGGSGRGRENHDRKRGILLVGQKTKMPSRRRDGILLITTCKEEFRCPWQAWQRPTLPGLKP